MRRDKYKMVITVDIDTDRLIDILSAAGLMVIACIMLVAFFVPFFGESTWPELNDDCVLAPVHSALPCPPVPSAADDQTFPLERPSWKP